MRSMETVRQDDGGNVSKKKWIKPGPMTGYPPGLLQDDDPRLSKWFATRLDARRVVRSVCKEIRNEVLPNGLDIARRG